MSAIETKFFKVLGPEGSTGEVKVDLNEDGSIVFRETGKEGPRIPSNLTDPTKMYFGKSEIHFRTSADGPPETLAIWIRLDDMAAFHRSNILFNEAARLGSFKSDLHLKRPSSSS